VPWGVAEDVAEDLDPGMLYRNTPLRRLGGMGIDAGTVARIIQARAAGAGFDPRNRCHGAP
jgi:hypothetical protein